MKKGTNKRKVFRLNTLGFNRCLDFGYYKYCSVEPVLEPHTHKDVLEICYCLKGQQYYKIGEDVLKLTGNNILIVPPNINHSTGVYPEDIGELYWIQISLDSSKGPLCYLPHEQSDFILQKLTGNGGKLITGAFGLKNSLKKMVLLLENPKNLFNRLQIGQLIITLLIETCLVAEKNQGNRDSERVKVLKGFIIENLHRTIYVDELAEVSNYSVPYLKSWFKLNFGVSPRAYINRLKIEKAKKDLLRNTSVTKVAYGLGFNSSQYFSTTFKKYTGTTPKTYRKLSNNKMEP